MELTIMSDETNVNYTEIGDHNELMEYIRRLLEKIRLLTGMYENNLALLTEHNEADNSHADIRELILTDRDAASKLVAELKSDIDDTINGVNKVLDEHDKRMWNITEVNNVQNDRLDAIELDLPLKIYDKDVSAIGHTGDFDDALYRPNITISDADKTNTGASVKLTKNKTELYLPNTIKATFVGNLTGNVTGNATSATKLQTTRTINGTPFNGTANITTANWGTARDVSIQDADGTNTSSAVKVNGSSAHTLKLPSTIKATLTGDVTGNLTGNVTGNATSATKLQTARSLWGNNFDGSQNLSGNIHFTNDDLTGVVVGAIGKVGNNDFWRVGGGATANDSGFMELATADNGNEPIYVRQYTGEYTTITRTATLLDASGNTQFPGTVTATAFYGTVTGNASSATKLQTARTINGTSFNGTANITTANWGTARNISITDGTNTSTAVSVNGSKAYSLNLPSTIKATFVGNLTGNVTGNCSGIAGGVAWTNVSGRPTKVSQFTNDSGYITTNGAAYPRRVGGVTMNFNWSGKGGQPTWLWGGEDGVNMYVYNPANFSVNYANSAGSASSATTATYASRSTSNGGFYISNHLVTIE